MITAFGGPCAVRQHRGFGYRSPRTRCDAASPIATDQRTELSITSPIVVVGAAASMPAVSRLPVRGCSPRRHSRSPRSPTPTPSAAASRPTTGQYTSSGSPQSHHDRREPGREPPQRGGISPRSEQEDSHTLVRHCCTTCHSQIREHNREHADGPNVAAHRSPVVSTPGQNSRCGARLHPHCQYSVGIDTFEQLRIEGVPTKDACALIGRARATHYRHLQPPVRGPAPARASPTTAKHCPGRGTAVCPQ